MAVTAFEGAIIRAPMVVKSVTADLVTSSKEDGFTVLEAVELPTLFPLAS